MANIVHLRENRRIGVWEVSARARNSKDEWVSLDITNVRNMPIKIGSISTTEPFGPATATLVIPGVSPLEPIGPGSADLWWLKPNTQVNISWHVSSREVAAPLVDLGVPMYYTWEGSMLDFAVSSASGASLSVECIGAMRSLDRMLSLPRTYRRPIPFEKMIKRVMQRADDRHETELAKLSIVLPSHAPLFRIKRETVIVDGKKKKRNVLPYHLRPRGVVEGKPYSGMLTREMGDWSKTLSEFIHPLLTNMTTNRGRYTISLDRGRKPRLHHIKTVVNSDDSSLLVINAVSPQVSFSLNQDYSQTLTTVYGEVNSTFSGTSYNGAVYDVDNRMDYAPFASTPWVDRETHNGRYQPGAIRSEIRTQFVDGLSVDEARKSAAKQLRRLSTPGYVGSIVLTSSDPLIRSEDGRMVIYPRQLIRPGQTVRLDGVRGQDPGVLLYISSVAIDVEGDKVTLSVDSKFRDYVGQREARMRGRDAMRPHHTMSLKGEYSSNTPDPLLRWSYEKGSGFFPVLSRKLWKKFGRKSEELEFPWTEMTTKYPPGNQENESMYCKIPASDVGRGRKDKTINPARFWSVKSASMSRKLSLMRLSQAGTISAFKIAAFRADGSLANVSFHVSIWALPTINASNMPKIPKQDGKNGRDLDKYHPNAGHYHKNKRHYKRNKPYPFFKDAWQTHRSDGTIINVNGQNYGATGGATLIAGWGNSYERPGYWPRTSRSKGAKRTGQFVTTQPFDFDMTVDGQPYDQEDPTEQTLWEDGTCRLMIFCDDRPREDIYFLARAYRQMPGV